MAVSAPTAPLARAASFANTEGHNQTAGWWTSPRCQAHYNEAVCGRAVTGSSAGPRLALKDAINGATLGRGISVGCGSGSKEIALLRDGLVDHMDLWDIAPLLRSEAHASASRAGVESRITYNVGDAFQGAVDTYDLVYWDHSLHHMSDVRAAVRWSVERLRPGGFLLVNDYIGANRLQYRRAEVAAANRFIREKGLKGRIDYSNPFTRFRQWYRDPSEAPDSESIVSALEEHLPGAEVTPIGGVALNILAGTVISQVPEDDECMSALLDLDAELRLGGRSHFAFCLWRKPAW